MAAAIEPLSSCLPSLLALPRSPLTRSKGNLVQVQCNGGRRRCAKTLPMTMTTIHPTRTMRCSRRYARQCTHSPVSRSCSETRGCTGTPIRRPSVYRALCRRLLVHDDHRSVRKARESHVPCFLLYCLVRSRAPACDAARLRESAHSHALPC